MFKPLPTSVSDWSRSDLVEQIAEGVTKNNECLSHIKSESEYSKDEAKDCQGFLRDKKPISRKGSEDASGHGRSSRDANSTGSITDFNWNQHDICLTKFGNENTLRNHLLTHVETYNRVEDAIAFKCFCTKIKIM